MQDETNSFNMTLSGLRQGPWLNRLAEIAQERGAFDALGAHHFAAFVRSGDTLLVTFETIGGMRALSDTAAPLGWELVTGLGWSHLCLASDGDTWFRDEDVYEYVDALIDDGFFDDFEQVIFYGAGPCAYAAAAFSVAAPGRLSSPCSPKPRLIPASPGGTRALSTSGARSSGDVLDMHPTWWTQARRLSWSLTLKNRSMLCMQPSFGVQMS